MTGRIERHMVVAVVAVSLTLTGLTVWAVAKQGQTLWARELADMRSAAETAAAQWQATYEADLRRSREELTRAWQRGTDDLEAWVSSQRRWLLVAVSTTGGRWDYFPHTPLEHPMPSMLPADESIMPNDPVGVRGALDRVRQLATSPDPLTRAGALLAIAAGEMQLGHPLPAARLFADAAQVLRATPHMARFAFRAELSRIDALVAAGYLERARLAYDPFLRDLLADHPARLGELEIGRLSDQIEAIGAGTATKLRELLAQLRARAVRREQVVAASDRALAAVASAQDTAACLNATTQQGETATLEVWNLSDDAQVAMIAPSADLLAEFWTQTELSPPCAIRHDPPAPGDLLLLRLGQAFGRAALSPTAEAQAHLDAVARRQMGVVLATAVGSAGAWALVIWLMIRAVARQRELARLQSRFVADISHELKTPLALIRLLAETLADRRVRDPERVHTYHETITRESERLSVLLDNILDMGRIESGRKQFAFAPCDVTEVARQAWALFEPQWHDQGFEARLEVSDGLPLIQADASALQQVIVNLLQNAYRYAGEARFVRLAVRREGYVIMIIVEDHGIGMSRAQLRRLGESFFRADDTRVRQTRGAGLGLAIVNHIVCAHGGRIEVHSRPGEGSTFTVWIPFEAPDGG